MKKLIIALLLLSSTVIAAPGEWIPVASSSDRTVYVNPTEINRFDQYATTWIRITYTQERSLRGGGHYNSMLAKSEFDCSKEQSRVLSVILYSGQTQSSEVVDTYNFTYDSTNWTNIAPGTLGHHVLKTVCNTNPKQSRG